MDVWGIFKKRNLVEGLKLGPDSRSERHLQHFWSFKNKLAISHTIVIKLKDWRNT